MRNFSETSVEKIKTHISCPTIFFSENHAVYEIMSKKNGKTGQATDGNMALHAGYLRVQTHTLRTHNSYCFCIGTMVSEHASNLR